MGVNLTRSLLAAPEELWLLGSDCNPYHLHLCLTHERALIPPATNLEGYLDALRGLIATHRIDMILPSHPSEVRTLATHGAQLGVRLHLPPVAVILAAQNKWDTYQALAAAGVPVPYTALINNEADLAACFDGLQTRPVWVRGGGVPGRGIGVASLPCRELDHARAWVDHWKGWGGFIASEYLPGRNLTWLGLYDRGRLIASQCRERLEYVIPHVSPSGITGAPAVSRTVSRPDLLDIGERALRVLSPEPNGAFFVDFKEDAQEVPRVTEINGGRFGTTIHFYTEAGSNFPWWMVQLAFGEAVAGAPLIDPVEPDTYWIRTLDCGPVLVRGADVDA